MVVACSGGEEAPDPDPAPEAAPTPAPEPAPEPEPKTEDTDAVADGREEDPASPLTHPVTARATAPDTYTVKFETTKGDILIDVTRSWAPRGADRFYNLVTIGFFEDIAIFRVIPGFMAQFGIHGDPAVAKVWKEAQIDDDPVTQSNTPGMITFATAGPNTRTTQMFMNLGDNKNLDGMGFAPFGKLRSMDVLETINDEYGEGAPRGRGPDQGRLEAKGNTYLKAAFPNLDYIVKASIVEE
jgi:peptidyl-prolyl cis-trans isomerase A (cyclophilin A)